MSYIKNVKKTSLKRKNINKCTIENEYKSDEECAKKKKRFSKLFLIFQLRNKIIKQMCQIFLLKIKINIIVQNPNQFIFSRE